MKVSKQRKKPAQNNLSEDYDTAMEMASIIAANLAAAAKETPNSNVSAEKFLKSLKSNTKMAGVAIAVNIPELEVGRPYGASEFLNLVKKYFESVSATQLSRALGDVSAHFRLEHIQGKSNIKKASKGRIRFEFDGRPSAYLLPSKVASIKRVYKNKNLVDKILSVLKESGILHLYLRHRISPFIGAIQKDTTGRYSALISSLFPKLAVDKAEWDRMRQALLTVNEAQLEQTTEKWVELFENMITDIPWLGQFILVLGFSKLVEEE